MAKTKETKTKKDQEVIITKAAEVKAVDNQVDSASTDATGVDPEQRRDQIISALCGKIETYNNYCTSGFLEDALKLAIEIDATLKDLQSQCKIVAYERFSKAEIPMAAAAKAFTYGSYRIETKTNELTGIPSKKLQRRDAQINVTEFDEYCSSKNIVAGANNEWKTKVERLHCALLVRRGIERGYELDEIQEIRDNLAMSEIAKQYTNYHDIEEGSDPTSMNQLIKKMQEIVNDMVGETPEHKIQKKDVLFMLESYTKEGRNNNDVIVYGKLDYTRVLFKICSKLEQYGPQAKYKDVVTGK